MPAEFLESALLSRAGFRHAFFTRRGGHSPPPFDSLHFGADRALVRDTGSERR